MEDQSNAVLPGVSITATGTTTKRTYLTTSDAHGNYRLLAVAAGTYRLEATLPGFSAAVIPALEVLIGQNITVQLTLKLAGLEEDVTVTGELPLVDTTSSRVASNVDRRQMEDLPLQGRNWMDLSLLVKGVTANNAGLTPGIREDQFNLTLDGQQIMQRVNTTGGSGQPKLSREAIAEFQIVTALFDVTQGRSTGAQVQAISRSGTNTTTGSVYGYARADAFNARDPVVGRVLPYENQQMGGSLGGPIIRDLSLEEFERRFPAAAWNNPAAWDLSGLDALVTRFDQNVGDNHRLVNRPMWGIWIGDTWRTTDRLTINYGVRWDDDLGITESHIINQSVFAPLGALLFKEGIRDHNNVAPRAGFVYDVPAHRTSTSGAGAVSTTTRPSER